MARAQAEGSSRAATRIVGVPAKITDELFKSPADHGLGLNKLEFYSPRNGFRWFPSDPTRSTNGATLHWNPYPDPSRVISCPEVPDPPGHLG